MKGSKLRMLFAVACCVAGAAVFASGAVAAPPDTFHVKDNGSGVFDFPTGSICPFEVSVDFIKDQFEEITYSNGVRRGAGLTVVEFTNVNTGETRRLIEGDQILHVPLSSDTEATYTFGPELSVFFPGDLGPGSAGAFLWIGGRSVEEDRYCIDILTQLAAVDTALESVALEILDDHVKHCVAEAIASGDEAEAAVKIEELLVAVRRFAKTR